MEMNEEWSTLYVYCLITLMNADGSLFDNSVVTSSLTSLIRTSYVRA